MAVALQFAILGLATGAIYSILAQGIVLIFRGSGVLNLAQGAIAMVAAFTFNTLFANHGWRWPTALLAGIALGAVIGVLADQVLLRKLRDASAIARLIATLAVLLLTQSIGSLLWGSTPVLPRPFITPHPVTVLGATTTNYQLILIGISLVLTTVLTTLWRTTRLGWVTEAVAENQRSAAAMGWSPNVVSAGTWAVGGGLAGAAGILISPITQLAVTPLTLLVIFALAAAMVGDFRSFPLTLLGAMAIGIAQAETSNYVHVIGLSDALPLFALILVLSLRGSALPLRGHLSERLPAVGIGRLDLRKVVPAFVLVAVGLSLVTSNEWQVALIATFAVAVVVLSLVVLTGYAGQLALGQAALAGIGALIAAQLASDHGWSFELCLLAGLVSASSIGLLFALPALRTRGVTLAVVTLSLGLAVQSMIFNNPRYTGESGLKITGQRLFGLGIDPLQHPTRHLIVSFVVFGLCACGVANIRRGPTGRRFLAIRANEKAAAASGINVFSTKAQAFAVSGAIAGLGGVLVAFAQTTATFDVFNPINSIYLVAEAIIGGIGFVLGPVAGALTDPSSIGSVVALSWQSFDKWLPILATVGLMATLLTSPDGVVATLTRQGQRLMRWFRFRHPADGSSELRVPQLTRVTGKTLRIKSLEVRYGPVRAIDHLSLDVAPGIVHGLIGPNGAGKTTLMDAVAGFTPYTGQVELDGQPIDRWSPHRRARAGLVRSFQSLELFDSLTIRENLLVASEEHTLRSTATDLVRPRRPQLSAAGLAAVVEFNLESCLDRFPTEVSYGQRRLVGIARAVAMEPSVLLLDEPAAGLDQDESRELSYLVRQLADRWGMAVLLIEHDMDFVMSICDAITVINFGREIASGTPAEIANSQAARAAYLGEASYDLPTQLRSLPVGAGDR